MSHNIFDYVSRPEVKLDQSWLGVLIAAKGCWAGKALRAQAVRLLKSWQALLMPKVQVSARAVHNGSVENARKDVQPLP